MNHDSPGPPLHLTADDPLSGLSAWLSDGRVDEAAAARVRRRWLERQAAEDATLTGLLIDLAERSGPVAVRSAGGRTARGRVVAVGADFVAVRESRLGDVLIPRRAVATVRGAPGEPPATATGDRPVSLMIVLAEALIEIAAERPSVLVAAAGDEIRGDLHAAGRDVVSVAVSGQGREVVHVAQEAIDHLVVLRR